ncbi:hypothetical protein SAY86_005732 [Trapa natans]|uniref:CCHC-type domain-containing protein n=1 Tax=Trapa natans TaxID=22666 RepID=A0AAN7L3Z0_TRANT|nr:hypothetical protein SAY86_005732 [Trapa natans]
MGSGSGSDVDDDFRELYKEYIGPPGSITANAPKCVNTKKRSHAGSDEEEEPHDPNAVPTDFTSREAKVWEAKSKATERNWKKKKEEEMICKICGDPGHFTQGCPSTLGANRNSQDFFERVAARDSHVRVLFTEKMMQKIQKDTGCKLRLEEKFLIVSGKDRLILSKGVDAVHKIIKDVGDQRGPSGSHVSRSRSPVRNPVGDRFRRSDSQRSNRGPPRESQFQPRFNNQERVAEDHIREDLQRFTKFSPPQVEASYRVSSRIKSLTRSSLGEAYGNDRSRSHSSCSKSPAHLQHKGNSYNSYNGHNQSMNLHRNDGERRGPGVQSGCHPEMSAFPQTLEELESEYKRDAMDLERIRDKEEDEENYKHREAMREMRESYMKKLSILKGSYARQFEEFLQLDAERHQQQAHQQISSSGFGYNQQFFSDYDRLPHPQYTIRMDPQNDPVNLMDNYPSRPHGACTEFQHRRHDGYGKNYGQY